MPASSRSPLLTSAYRDRLAGIVARQRALAEEFWPPIDNFDQAAEAWRERTARTLAGGQVEAVRASVGYLTAFVSTELGRRVRTGTLDSLSYVKSRDGRPLTESLRSPVIGVLAALKDGLPSAEALHIGLNRALRMVEVDLMHAARTSLNDAMEQSEHVEGWQRAVRGTCGACMGDIAVEVSVELPSVPLQIHPNCQCVTQPVVVGVPDRFPLATGNQIFKGLPKAAKAAAVGSEAAQLLDAGEIELSDLVATSTMATQADFLTQAPAKDA